MFIQLDLAQDVPADPQEGGGADTTYTVSLEKKLAVPYAS